MPEWYLVLLTLVALAAAGAWWAPLGLVAAPLLAIGLGWTAASAAVGTARAGFSRDGLTRSQLLARWMLTALLHGLQPLARLRGRLSAGLTPWRCAPTTVAALPRSRTWTLWSESWRTAETWLRMLEDAALAHRARVRRGGDFDRWDLEVGGGPLAGVRIRAALEEHGRGRQLLRIRVWPHLRAGGLAACLLVLILGVGAAVGGLASLRVATGALALVLGVGLARDAAVATGAALLALRPRTADVRAPSDEADAASRPRDLAVASAAPEQVGELLALEPDS
jgi:hypothetical protein